jgi:hypothetical protein
MEFSLMAQSPAPSESPTTPGYSYIARKSCGCIVGAVADDPDQKKRTARRTGEWIQAGYTVERVTDDVVRAQYTGKCPHQSRTQVLFE